MRFEEIQKKAGVSLVTVLLFMLVATIAATATYKWLSSEGRSSASRMMQNEAYLSALAGIESARSWMTYNANETGAIIRQYKKGNNAPIKLNDQLSAFVRAGQHFDVYLVGVNTESSTYKLKLLSEGTSRNGEAKHSEVAILNVNGLYQVTNPKRVVKKSPIDFDAPYFGGTSGGTQSKFTSIMINGDWQGNQGDYPEKFIVTGNASLTGNHNNIGMKYSCIGGNLDLDMQGITSGGNLFVGGNVSKAKIKIDSSAWFDGNVDQTDGTTSNYLQVGKSVTLNGTFKTNQVTTDRYVSIGEDFCTTENARVISKGNLATFVVEGDVWMPGAYNISTDPTDPGIDNYDSYDKIVLGNSVESKVHIKAGHAWNDYGGASGIYNTRKFPQVRNGTQNNGYRFCSGTPVYTSMWSSFLYCSAPDDGWDNETWQPYSNKAYKDNLHYIYYMPEGRTDVGFGPYTDDIWRWCGETDYWGNCNKAGNYVTIQSYFIDYSAMTKPNSFTTSSHSFDANHTVNVPKDNDARYYRYLNHDGTKVTGSPYCRLNTEENKSWQPVCGVTPWFKSNGTLSNDMSETNKPQCAQAVYDSCDALWEKKPGCSGSQYFIDDPIEIPLAEIEAYANKGCDKPGAKSWGPALVKDLNECWEENHKDEEKRTKNLYNGEYQVVKLQGEGKNDISGTLTGKFVIIAEEKITARNEFITAADDGKSYVLLYLKKGAFILPTNNKPFKHLFIYMNEANDAAKSEASHLNLTGTLYFPAAKCIENDFKDADFKSDTNLIADLSANGVICKKGTPCGAGGSGEDPLLLEEDDYEAGVPDDYYISVAPQLSVSLESQYKNNENVGGEGGGSSVDASFIVLPRIIYLTKDAKGKLSDYYNIVPLNAVTPANASSPVSGVTVNCEGVPTSGPLGELTESVHNCSVQATVNGKTGLVASTVPFWVVVSGQGGNKHSVSFVKSTEELAIESATTVDVTWDKTTGAGASCQVVVSVTGDGTKWDVTKADGVTQNGNDYSFTFNTSNTPPMKIFDVQNKGSNDGSVMFLIKNTVGCAPGDKSVEVIYNTNGVNVIRKDLDEYCSGVGSGEAVCAKKDWPNCSVGDETWIGASNGTSCNPVIPNNKWKCDPTGTIFLKSAGDLDGCQIIIPSENNTRSEPFEANENITLYASIKAIPQKFYVQYDVTGDLADDQAIYISVDGESKKTCRYGDYKDATRKTTNCEVDVFRGSVVKLSFNSNPAEESVPPSEFNYWMCEGANCNDNTETATAFVRTITGSNTVVAHFGENDKHCFFDEFKDEHRNNRASVECGESGSGYCIQTCDEDGPCGSVVNGSTKWRLMEGSMENIEYNDGRISLKSSATRSGKQFKSEADKASIRTVIMSTAQAGKDGELKAQFQVPVENGAAKATIRNSGFILRSDAGKSDFLMLNVFASNGTLKARLCVNGDENKCHATKTFTRLRSITSTDIIMMSAKFAKQDANDVLWVKVWPSSWASDLDADDVTFTLTESSIPGVSATAQNEYVGYSLADPNFKLYGIGWKSYTYNAQCWDMPPSISCSFKAAYAGGIVPLNESVAPWTGLSAWYNTAYANGCRQIFYYNNGGEGGCYGSSLGDGYSECGSSYQFSTEGAHGFYSDTEKKDIKTAKVSVADCDVTGPAASWANQGVAAHCGSFWVGKMVECYRNETFDYSVGSAGEEYYAVDAAADDVANLRDADLKVFLDNPNGDEVEIYLYSMNRDDSYSYGASKPIYSLPYKTVASGTVTISVNSLSTVDGFDPERVHGVYVKTSGTARVTSNPTSSCPHILDIDTCYAVYEESAKKWKITTLLTGADAGFGYKHVQKVVVHETSGYTNATEENNEKWTSASKIVTIDEDNPYGSDYARNYTFSVTLTPDVGEPKGCETKPVEMSAFKGICKEGLTGATTRKQGTGLPVFSYDVLCPTGTCGYKVVLTDADETVVVPVTSASGTVNGATDANAANKDTPLDVGTYKFKLVSTDGKFTECSSTASFEVTTSAVTADDCSFEPASVVLGGGTVKFKASSFSVQNENISVRLEDTDGNSLKSEPSFWANNTFEYTFTPASTGSLTYILKAGSGEACRATLTVNPPSATCSITPTSVTKGGTITVGLSSISPTNSNVHVSVEENGSSKDDVQSLWSPNGYSKTFTMSSVGSFEYKVSIMDVEICKETITVNAPVPDVGCPTDKISYTIGESQKFKATKLENCDNGCDYVLQRTSGGTAFASSDAGTYSSKDTEISLTGTPVAAEDNVAYTFIVYDKSNHEIYGNCTGTMQFVEPPPSSSSEESSSSAASSSSTACTASNWIIDQYNSNKEITGTFTNGCFELNTQKACKKAQVQASESTGSGTFKINGTSITCGTYYDNSITAQPVIKLEVPSTCTVKKIYVSDCNAVAAPSSSSAAPASSASGGVISVSVGYQSYIKYEAGKTYELTMAGGAVFRCTYDYQVPAVTIGTFGGATFGAAANQSQATANNPGSGKKVTFVVTNDISGSLKCANDW